MTGSIRAVSARLRLARLTQRALSDAVGAPSSPSEPKLGCAWLMEYPSGGPMSSGGADYNPNSWQDLREVAPREAGSRISGCRFPRPVPAAGNGAS